MDWQTICLHYKVYLGDFDVQNQTDLRSDEMKLYVSFSKVHQIANLN